MTDRDPRTLPAVPMACRLSPSDGRDRLEAWRAFDDDYLLTTEDRGTARVAVYALVPDSEERLARLVEQESACCAFATWSIERTAHHLRLVVGGSADALAALGPR